MKLRRYCVTVMDNWTPMREFFTLNGALKFQDRHESATTFKWQGDRWVKIFGAPNIGE